MKTKCTCANPKPIPYGSWDPPVYVCGHCGKNLDGVGHAGNCKYRLADKACALIESFAFPCIETQECCGYTRPVKE